MSDVISKLTAAQALHIVERLGQRGGATRDAVLAEAMAVLTRIDLDQTADEVVSMLDSIDKQDCWDRSGGSADGYTSPDEAAGELIDEELQPFVDQVDRYHEMGLPGQEATYCKGVLLGLYRYEQESESEFGKLSVDIPAECGRALFDTWRKRTRGTAEIGAMRKFLQERCPQWAGWLKDKKA